MNPVDQPRSTLRPEDYVSAAVQFVDEHGFSALTMRALGEVLGVDPTAVYRHFANKDALVAGVLDAVIKEIITEAPEVIEDPVQWLKDLALLASSKIVTALEMIGLKGEQMIICYQAFEGFVLGSVVFDLLGAPHHLEIRRLRHRLLNHADFDNMTRTEAEVQQFSWRALEFGVNALLSEFLAIAKESDS